MLALPIFPGSRPPSIVGANELNFCVRDGNRWTLIAINTNYIRYIDLFGCNSDILARTSEFVKHLFKIILKAFKEIPLSQKILRM